MALADELTDKIMHIARDVAREQLLQMVGEIEVRAIAAVEELGSTPAPRSQAAEPFLVTVVPPPTIPRPPADRGMQTEPAAPSARTSDGKKLPTCRACGFYGGNTRGCGRSHRTLAKPQTTPDDEDDEPPGPPPLAVVPRSDGGGEAPRVPVRLEPAAAVRPPQAPVAAVEDRTPPQQAIARTLLVGEVARRVEVIPPHSPPVPKNSEPPPCQDDGPGTPCTLGTRASDERATGPWAEPGPPLRLGVDKREVCPVHGWLGNITFLRDRHDLCEAPVEQFVDEEADDDRDESVEIAPVRPAAGDDPIMLRDGRHRVRNPEVARSRTVAAKKITRESLRSDDIEYARELAEIDKIRPRRRSDCVGGLRPCPFAGCRYHLAIDVNPETGSIKITFPDLDLSEMPETCALDVADRGASTLEVVGSLLNVTRERLRQLEVKALMAIKMSGQSEVLDGGELPVSPDQN